MTDRERKRVLLVGWDGADWEHIDPLLEAGLMPHLDQLINHGVMGNLATMQPILSPMLWNTVATGKLPDQHGICGFMEPDPINGGARPVTSLSRKVKAIWNILCQEGYRCNVVGWWASHPAEPINGHIVSNNCKAIRKAKDGSYQVPAGTIHPAEMTDLLAPCYVSAAELTQDDIYPFIPDAYRINSTNDQYLQSFAKILTGCATVQAMATAVMSIPDWDFTAIYFDAIDHFCHSFMPFHPPKIASVDQELFEIYQHVIKGAYRFHDMMLGAQMALAGEDALVILCSDHGFLSGDRRPMTISNEPAGPADWHRDLGIIAMAGPGVKRDERVYGATLIDITPTILAYLGLPIGRDMQGRPLTGAFDELPEVTTIDSWEDVEGEAGMHPPGTELPEEQTDELRKQFVALGYVEDHGDNKEKASESAETEINFNLARVYLATNRAGEAVELLQELTQKYPWEMRFVRRLAHSYFLEGYYEQCVALLQRAYPEPDPMPAMMRLVKGRAWLAIGANDQAMECFLKVLDSNPWLAEVHVQLGRVFIGQGDLTRAQQAFEKALEIDSQKAIAHQGLARVHLKNRADEEAARSALDAVGILHHLPRAHYVLGQALARLGEYQRSAQAFETSLHLNPTHANCHRWLSVLYRSYLDDPTKAEWHAEMYRTRSLEKVGVQLTRVNRSHEKFDLPNIPSKEQRQAILAKERPSPASRAKVEPGSSGRSFTLVSGLPRSGTSLMMQMLVAAGLPAKTDGQRVADVDNPEGYYEWEAIKKVRNSPELLDEEGLDQKVIKVISMLLGDLPKKHQYKIVFMQRPVEEVAASQRKMIDRLETEGAELSAEQIAQRLHTHRRQIVHWLGRQSNVELCLIDFPELVQDPRPSVAKLVKFLGRQLLPHSEKMAEVVRPDLYRQKSR